MAGVANSPAGGLTPAITNQREEMMADKFTDFQKRVEGVLDDIVEYYENGTDAADDVVQWARDWATQREIDWLELQVTSKNNRRKGY